VLIIVVVGTAAAYLIDAGKTKIYAASTSVYVNLNDNVAAQFAAGSQQFELSSPNELADLAQLLQSPSAARSVQRQLHTTTSPAILQRQITVVPEETTDFINISAKGTDPRQVAALANAYANAFIQQGRQQVDNELTQLRIQTDDQLAALPTRGPGVGAQRTTLQERLKSLQNAANNPDTAEQQVGAALPPTVAISPHPKKVAVFALFVSLLVAILLVYLLERLDQRIKDMDALSEAYGLPLLAVVPHSANAAPKLDGMPVLPAETLEALRMLRMSIGLQTLDSPIKTLLVTSAMPGEGKSTVARDLALVYSEAGVDVAVIDADLRRGSLTQSLTPGTTSAGLTGILLGEASLSDAQVSAKVALPSDGRRQPGLDTSALTVIPSGGMAANPPAILGSMRMATLVRELADEHEMLIIDTPPLLTVSDTLPLLSIADGVVIVGRVKTTRRDAINRTRGVLERVGRARVLGLVANDVAISSRSYLYGYGPQPSTTGQAPESLVTTDTKS